MIAKLSGILDSAGPDGVIVDVGGVGYLVFCSARTLRQLPGKGEAVRLVIETHVREDHIHLYGFLDTAERDWFQRLTTVQGVGARLALAILSAMTPDELSFAILAQDKTTLTRAEGVGPRLAARIVNELRDKIANSAAAATPSVPIGPALEGEVGPAADAISALVNLGYRRAEAFGAIAAASQRLGTGAEAGALIRAGLQELSR
jgi:holliday junction DNA helicase RuvA